MPHYLLGAGISQGLQNDRQIRVIVLGAENARAAHTVKFFEYHIAVYAVKIPQFVHAATDDEGWAALGEFGGKQLFVAISKAVRFVDYQRALALQPLQ